MLTGESEALIGVWDGCMFVDVLNEWCYYGGYPARPQGTRLDVQPFGRIWETSTNDHQLSVNVLSQHSIRTTTSRYDLVEREGNLIIRLIVLSLVRTPS